MSRLLSNSHEISLFSKSFKITVKLQNETVVKIVPTFDSALHTLTISNT